MKYSLTKKFLNELLKDESYKNLTDTQLQKVLETFAEIKEENRYLNLNIILKIIIRDYK